MKKILLLLLLSVSAGATAATPDISVTHARIRWLPGALPMAGYFDLHNASSEPLVLNGAASDAFGRVGLHRSLHGAEGEGMVPVDSVTAAPGGDIQFAPGGYHLMLMKRQKQIAVGDTLTITLHFADGRTLDVAFHVQGADTQ
ncbi:MAG: copper chaperone PCu(A)C [Gammaproteobacteria bacterium]|jgi:hypothetical protein